MGFSEESLSHDTFLGGRLTLGQPRAGYRAGVDPVLLAASVPAVAGQSVLELGCGAGAAILCLGARVPGLALSGLEVQADYAVLAGRNAAANGLSLEVVTGDLMQMPVGLRAKSFDHVIANPPYFERSRSTRAQDAGRDRALGGDTPLAAWFDAGLRRLAPKGTLTVIQRAARLPEMLTALDERVGSVAVLPLAPRAGRAAKLVLLRAIKGGRGAFCLLPPQVLHQGAAHDGDRESYVPEVNAVLRDGAAMPWPIC